MESVENFTQNATTDFPANVTTNDTWNGTDVGNTGGASGSGSGPISWDDATWILACSFIIFTMQSGFGLLEAGCVTAKNEVNIMMKNAIDVIFGGLTYWMFGYGLSFGEDEWSNPFVGVGKFCLDSDDPETIGLEFSTYIFQLSFATTATTIVSGAMAERTRLDAYVVFSLLNTVVYCVPAHWLWGSNGFLSQMGAIDIAGSGGVHLVGGVAGLVATVMLGPRIDRFSGNFDTSPGNATNMVVGMFMLWWGWLGFNCGSTFGISGGKWKLAAKAAVTTLNASVGGGFMGIMFSVLTKNRRYDVGDMVNSILGALVGITAGCAIMRPWQAVVIGAVGGLVAVLGIPMFEKLKIDDPVGALSVHGLCGIWGMLSVGLFVEVDPIEDLTSGRSGVFVSGDFYLLGVQLLACVVIAIWSGTVSFCLLYAIDKTLKLRMSEYEEKMGADILEHGVGSASIKPDDNPYASHHRSSFGFVRHAAPKQPDIQPTITEDPRPNGDGETAPPTETEEKQDIKEEINSGVFLTKFTSLENGQSDTPQLQEGTNNPAFDWKATAEPPETAQA